MRQLRVHKEKWPVRGVFAISRGSRTEIEVVVAEVVEGDCRGRGEGHPYTRYHETLDGVAAELEKLSAEVAGGIDCESLQEVLPAGAARNALDCALWDLRARQEGVPVWKLAGIREAPAPALSAFTLSVDRPEAMAARAREHAGKTLLKVKLAGEGDLERMRAVREAAPKARLIVDANEAWTEELYRKLVPELAAMRVELVEQPLPAGKDACLRGLERPVPLGADESCHDRSSLPGLEGLYDFINIKLDKTGGLTEAVRLAATARERGFRIMVGCMLGTSLAMAPATLLSGYAEFVDLDGPLLLAKDRENGLRFEECRIQPPGRALWGY